MLVSTVRGKEREGNKTEEKRKIEPRNRRQIRPRKRKINARKS